MNISWNELTPVIEVCAPVIAALWAFYIRLSYKIEENSRKMDEKWEKQRSELKSELAESTRQWREELAESKKQWKAIDERWERLFSKLAERT